MGGGGGGVGEPALLHGQGQVWNSVDVTAHDDLVSHSSLEKKKILTLDHASDDLTVAESVLDSKSVAF